jgi:hydroxymethylglutaryl-CoA synthase
MSALAHAQVSGDMIEEILVGSESHPHAVYPTASKVAGLIGSTGGAADTEFACKAGTHGMRLIADSVESRIRYGLAIGADSSQAAPGDSLEYNAGDGGVAFVMGKSKPIAKIEGCAVSFTSDTPDFWRNADENYPRHAERFTLEPGYYHHVKTTATKLMKSLDLKPKDFDAAVFHQPTRDLPRKVGKILGFTDKQIEPGIVVDFVGNLYSACSPLGLAKVLDEASPGERILLVSYGSGAGSDAFSFVTTDEIEEKRKNIKRSVKSWIGEEDKHLVQNSDYATYARYKGLFKSH